MNGEIAMKNNNTNQTKNTADKPVFRGELALFIAVIINSFGVVLMLHSGSGISAISSVPYAFSLVLPKLSLGTWTYIFQGTLILTLMIPTDLFPRELSAITNVRYSRIKISFDVICLFVTGCMTFFFIGHIDGLGIGTILAAFTMGKVVAIIGDILDKKFTFETFKTLSIKNAQVVSE